MSDKETTDKAATEPMHFSELEDYMDVVMANTQNLLKQIQESDRGILGSSRENKQGIMSMVMNAGSALIMEKIAEYLRQKRSNVNIVMADKVPPVPPQNLK